MDGQIHGKKARFYDFLMGGMKSKGDSLIVSGGKVHKREKRGTGSRHWEQGEKGKIFHGFRWEEKELVSTGLWGILEKGNRSHLKPSNTSQKQVLPGTVTWNSHLLISIWFYIVFLFFCKSRYYLVDWCGRKGPQIVLLRLVAYLFAQNLFVIFSTSPSPLKDHEMWLYLISIMPVCYLLVFSVLHYTFFYPSS